jgi:hypothetical protein
MKEFNVQALLDQIEATVVPELPHDHHPIQLERYVAAVLSQIILVTSEEERKHLCLTALLEAQRLNQSMMEFTTYVGNITIDKFNKFSDEQKVAMTHLNTLVQRSAAIAHVYVLTMAAVIGKPIK